MNDISTVSILGSFQHHVIRYLFRDGDGKESDEVLDRYRQVRDYWLSHEPRCKECGNQMTWRDLGDNQGWENICSGDPRS